MNAENTPRTALPLASGERFAVLVWDWRTHDSSWADNKHCYDLGLVYGVELGTREHPLEVRTARELDPEQAQALYDAHEREDDRIIPVTGEGLKFLFEIGADT